MSTNSSGVKQQLKKNANEMPLFRIADANVDIYSDCIVANSQLFAQLKTQDTGDFISCTDGKLESQPSLDQQLTIRFNNPDFAFNIDEATRAVEIHDIVKHIIVLKFQVKTLQSLYTIQSLLKRKLCELGFEKRYRIVKELGKGATAVVHLIERLTDGKLFAAKIISIKDANDRAYETFINESKLLRILKHKNIIYLESLYVHKKQLIQVIEYFSGGTLLQLIRNNPTIVKKERWRILRDINAGLEFLRERRIVHRDIKMENILVRVGAYNQKQYVITDFGLATWIGETNLLFERCGTPGYIAPEILNAPKGKAILSHKVDIFSLGAIGHVLFLNQPLFPYSGNIKELLKLNKIANYNLKSSLYQDLTISQYSFLEMTVAKDLNLRASSKDLINEIRYLNYDTELGSSVKSARKGQKQITKIESLCSGFEVEVERTTSTCKNRINLSQSKIQTQKKQQKKSNSASKLIAQVWETLRTPKNIKIKQNSVQKHKKMKQYCE